MHHLQILLYFTENSNQDEMDCLRKPGSLPDLAGPQIDHLIKVRIRNVVELWSLCLRIYRFICRFTLFDKGDMKIKDI